MPKNKTAKKTARSTPDPLGQVKALLFGAELTAHKQQTRTTEMRLQKKLERQSAAVAEQVTRLSTKVTKAKQSFDESLDELRREGARVQREVKQEVANAVQQLQGETAKALNAVEARVAKMLRDVQQSATDRMTLAALFEDFARRVGAAGPTRKK